MKKLQKDFFPLYWKSQKKNDAEMLQQIAFVFSF